MFLHLAGVWLVCWLPSRFPHSISWHTWHFNLYEFFCPLLAIEYRSFLCFHIVPSLPVSASFLFLNHFSSSQHIRLWILAIFLSTFSEQLSTEQLVFETLQWIFTCSYEVSSWLLERVISSTYDWTICSFSFLGQIRSWAIIFSHLISSLHIHGSFNFCNGSNFWNNQSLSHWKELPL